MGNSINPGILEVSSGYKRCALDRFDIIVKYCMEKNINHIVIGPEAPLADGLVDNFSGFNNKDNFFCLGPKYNFSKIESSKSYCREIMEKYKMNNYSPEYSVFNLSLIHISEPTRPY